MTVTTPFDAAKLDGLMEHHGLDAVVATTKHNIQHLLGGYRYFFFALAEATGTSRYLPALGLVRGDAERAFYVGAGNEDWGTEHGAIWVQDIQNVSWSSTDTARAVAAALHVRGLGGATIGVEMSFIPADALDSLRALLPKARFVDCLVPLETMRAVKRPDELDLVRAASIGIVESMQAAFAAAQPGMSKKELEEVFRQEQTRRGMYFEYALVTIGGGSHNRAPNQDVWRSGTTLSLDSGGMLHGYIGDLSRVGIDTEPTPRMISLLDQVEELQQSARTAVAAGRRGGDIYTVAEDAISRLPDGDRIRFVAHGMGLITHEAPRLTATGPVPYPATHADSPLEAGMVLSIESWFEDDDTGFIKLEDTLIVTDDGWEAPGDEARGWNRTGVPR